MKKTAIFLVFFVLVALLNAQNPALSVPKFKGIEITGTVDQFGSKLTNQGFKFLGNEDYGSVYMGSFAGMNDCVVILVPVVNSKNIASVNVMIGFKLSDYDFYTYESWDKLLNDYNNLKDLLTQKYGEPTEENEGFSKDASTYSSYLKLNSVKKGQCEYHSIWGDAAVDKMIVELAIQGGKNMGFETAVILLRYWNVDKTRDSQKEILDDL